jgi:hypothetical protein
MAIVVAAITAMMLALVMLLLGFAGARQILAQLQPPPRTTPAIVATAG